MAQALAQVGDRRALQRALAAQQRRGESAQALRGVAEALAQVGEL